MAAACIDGAHTTAASPRQPVGEVPPRRGERVRELGTFGTTSPNGADLIDRIVRKYVAKSGLRRGFSAHSMRVTFITCALDNGASLEEVQRAAGHADATTTMRALTVGFAASVAVVVELVVLVTVQAPAHGGINVWTAGSGRR